MLITIKKIVKNCLASQNKVTEELVNGVEEDDLVSRFSGKFIAPGVSIRQHLYELKKYGCIRHEGNKIFLKDECNPINLLEAVK